MIKLIILLVFCLNCCYCYKQQQQQQQQPQTMSLPKPQAIIHLPENIYAHKITDSIELDHDQLSNYLSSINYIPHTIHKHAQLLAQLDPADIQKYGQTVSNNHLPLISLTMPDSKSSEYTEAAPQQNYAQPQQQNYAQPQQQQDYAPQTNNGYQQQSDQQSYNQPQQQNYAQPQQQQDYAPPQAPRKNCHQNKQNSDGYGQQMNSQEYNGSGGGYNNDGGSSNEGNNGYDNKSPEMDYQSGPMENNNYDSGNNNYQENNGGGSYENTGGQQNNNGYSNNNQQQPQQQDYDKSNNEGNDYESSNYAFNYDFVQEILRHVMSQIEQLQIDPDSLNAYGRMEDSNQDGDGGYDMKGKQGIQLVDKPEGAEEVNYGYSINHGTYQNEGSSNEPSYSSSATSSQATSYMANEPSVTLDNKLPINQLDTKDRSTVTYQMPTINLELPKKQIEHIMKAISSKKGRYSQPIMIKANSFKLPSNLNLGKIKTIAFIKSSKLGNYKDLTYSNLNTQLLGSNLNNLNNYKMVSSNKEEIYDNNPVLSAYGYGVNMPSSKLYASSSSNKKSIISLPLKNRSKRLGNSYSTMQAASSSIKSIISALPKISKNKKVSSKLSSVTSKTAETIK